MSNSKFVLPVTGFLLITTLILVVKYYQSNGLKAKKKNDNGNDDNDMNSYVVYPPLPNQVVKLLMASRLCFLATQTNNNDPHLSLMNFTYFQAEEILIMTTRKNTKKYDQMKQNKSVAVLIHDFPNLDVDKDKTDGNTVSITLNGFSSIINDEIIANTYRNIHLQNNPDYKQFIEGNEVIIIRIEKARICDIKDKVTHWDAKEAIKET